MRKTILLLFYAFSIALLTWNCGGEGGTRQASLDSTQTVKPEEGDDYIDFEDDKDTEESEENDSDDFMNDFEDGIEDFADAIKDLGDDIEDFAKNFEKEFSFGSSRSISKSINGVKRKMSSQGGSFKVINGKIRDYSEGIFIKLYEKRGTKKIKAVLKEKEGKFQFKVIEDTDSLIKSRYGDKNAWLKDFLKTMNDKKTTDIDDVSDEDFEEVLDELDDFDTEGSLLKILRNENLTDENLVRIVEEIYSKVILSKEKKLILKKVIR